MTTTGSRSTVYDYLAALERLMVLDPIMAWSPHLRSGRGAHHTADPVL